MGGVVPTEGSGDEITIAAAVQGRTVRPLHHQKRPSREEQNVTQDVNTSTTADDFYDDATDGFAKVEHLAPSLPPKFGMGRLLAIWVTGEGKRKNDKGDFYPFVETVTVTLDDGPEGLDAPGWDEMAAELVPSGWNRLDKFQHSTGGLVARLQKRLTGRNKADVPLRFRPMIGRINTQPSRQNKNVPAYSISAPTDEDRAIIEQYGDRIRAINVELERAATTGEDPDKAAFSE
jgi:hypothetical protein